MLIPPPSKLQGRAAFTLLELLAVIAIFGTLLALLFPVMGRMSRKSANTESLNKLRQLGVLAQLYSQDNNGLLIPGKSSYLDVPPKQQWQVLLAPYLVPNAKVEGIWNVVTEKGPTRKEFGVFWLTTRFPTSIVSRARYYDSGYGINMQPGLPEIQTPNSKESDDQPTPWSRPFNLNTIAKGPARLLFAEWPFWNMYIAKTELGKIQTYADSQGGALRAVFFDGHCAELKPQQVMDAYHVQ